MNDPQKSPNQNQKQFSRFDFEIKNLYFESSENVSNFTIFSFTIFSLRLDRFVFIFDEILGKTETDDVVVDVVSSQLSRLRVPI